MSIQEGAKYLEKPMMGRGILLGGVPGVVVCDQLKSGVTVPCRYEPGLQRTYEEFAQHYGTAILPARPR